MKLELIPTSEVPGAAELGPPGLLLPSPRPEFKETPVGSKVGVWSAGALQAKGWDGPSLGMSHSSCSAVNVGGPSLLSDTVAGGGGRESIGREKPAD